MWWLTSPFSYSNTYRVIWRRTEKTTKERKKTNEKENRKAKLFWKLILYMLTLRRNLTTSWYLFQLKMPDYVARAFQLVIIAAKIWLQGRFIITSPQLDSWTFASVKSCSQVTGTSCVGHTPVTIWSIPTPQIHSPFWVFACCYTEKQTLTQTIFFQNLLEPQLSKCVSKRIFTMQYA